MVPRPEKISKLIKNRKSSIAQIYIYIYISIYKRGPISRVQDSQSVNPPGSAQRKKSLFLVFSIGSVFQGLLEAPGKSFGRFFGGVWYLFFGIRLGVCEVCEKVFFWSVSWSEEQRSCIAKTCKSYSTSFKNRRCALTALCSPTRVPRLSILDLKSLFLSLQLVPDFLVLWRLV